MDVILDANIILGDLKFRGTQFGELFAYLRRTNCNLVLPTLVTLEVLERYKERLKNNINQAKGSWVSLSSVTMTEHMPFPTVDLEKETKQLSSRLDLPAPGVNVVRYADVSGIDANEIARRGAKRLKPANSNGEELRDVILWLVLFQYARKTGRDIALISGDNGFRQSKDEDSLHPDLQDEILSENLPIHFYREVSSFVTSQSLSQAEVDEKWLEQYLSSQDLAKSIVDAIAPIYFSSLGTPKDIRLEEVKLVGGTQYQISRDSVYGEVRYKVNATLTFDYVPTNVSFVNNVIAQDYPQVSGSILFPNQYVTGIVANSNPFLQYPMPSTLNVIGYTPNVAAGMVSLQNTWAGIGHSPNLATNVVVVPSQPIEKEWKFDVSVSLRVEAGKLLNWQLDEIV